MKNRHLPCPNRPDVEKAVLSAFMRDADEAFNLARSQYPRSKKECYNLFYTPEYRLVFKTIAEMYKKKEPIDVCSLRQRLQDKVSGVCIAEIFMATTNNSHLPTWNYLLVQCYMLRSVIKVCADFVTKCENMESDSDSQMILDNFRAELRKKGFF